MFSTPTIRLRRMTFGNISQSLHHYIAAKPICVCTSCCPTGATVKPVLRSQFASWRITCENCSYRLQDGNTRNYAPFIERYEDRALQGEKLLDEEIERGVKSWTSPTRIAQLLLMRRFTGAVSHHGRFWRFRILGELIPELDEICGPDQELLPSAANPILPLHIRLLWLAGVAIVERAGPAMLDDLRWLMLNGNGIDFGETATLAPAKRGVTILTRQMQYIRESLP